MDLQRSLSKDEEAFFKVLYSMPEVLAIVCGGYQLESIYFGTRVVFCHFRRNAKGPRQGKYIQIDVETGQVSSQW
ncbi:MAG: hypothetical protein GTO63_31445 [Anaerolineae bacterium]|nr:hypothetical protein [Anaerolineae bacterium]NIN99207.1 hypothetical protein [Anaerolineae bacterium]NIQ82048.1 hypothetical protein [Anaerolineae bacterium]